MSNLQESQSIYMDGFLSLIRHRLGILVKNHQITEVQKLVIKACEKFHCEPAEYLEMLTHCSDDSPLLEHMVVGITVGETFFFRDNLQITLLREKILPALINKKRAENNLCLRIWSAGCSSGEEIYTLAMILSGMLADLPNWALHLLGTDINTTALQKAIAGIYGEWSMRAISDNNKKTFFRLENNRYILDKKIRDLATFSWLNLNDDLYPSMFNGTSAQDLILCRNVLIYFDSQHIARLMQKLDASLSEGSYLMLGASDPVNLQGTHLWHSGKEGTLFLHTNILAPVKQFAQTTSPQNAKKIIFPVRRQVAKETIKIRESVETPSQKILTLANAGNLTEAGRLCTEQLAMDTTSSELHFIYGMILADENRLEDALAELRKSIFLDRSLVAGHFQLGLLLFRMHQHDAGMKNLHNALSIAKSRGPHEKVKGYEGMNYGRLSDILTNEIELHEKIREKYTT